MSSNIELSYALVITLMTSSFIVSAFSIPILIRLANRLGIVDIPNQNHKTHKNSIPYLGGASLFVPIFFCSIYLSIKSPRFSISEVNFQVIAFLSGCIFFVGLIDDLRNLSVKVRFICQFIAATVTGVLLMQGESLIQVTSFETINLVFAIVWIVGVTNAFNLFDNLDGALASVIICSSAGISLITWNNNQSVITFISLALLSASCAFLIWNFRPAQIYLGDAGALFSGFLISILLYLSIPKTGIGTFNLATPLLLILLPLIDTLLVIGSRLITGSRLFYGNTDHLAHRLLSLGLGVRQIFFLFFLVSLLAASAAIFLEKIYVGIAYSILGTILTLTIYVIVIFWNIDHKKKKKKSLDETDSTRQP